MTPARPCLVVGRPNAGKTLVVLSLLQQVGLREAEFEFVTPTGESQRRRLSLARARALLVTPLPHETRRLQRVLLVVRRPGRSEPWLLVDSTGLPDGVHPDPQVRLAVAQTLAALGSAAAVLHVVDAAALGEAPGSGLSRVDLELARYAPQRAGYAIVANKADLPWARSGIDALRRAFPQHPVWPVSALCGTGVRSLTFWLGRLGASAAPGTA